MLTSCDSKVVIKEYSIERIIYSDSSYLKDSLALNNFIVSNEVVSGWDEEKKIAQIDVRTGLLITQDDFNRQIYKFKPRKYYIIDTIRVKENVGFVILRVERGCNAKTLYLSLFDKQNRCLNTYLLALNIDIGDGLLGGGKRIKSILTSKGILTTYSLTYGYLDCGTPPYVMDSVISRYNLNNGETVTIDTVKSIKPQGMT